LAGNRRHKITDIFFYYKYILSIDAVTAVHVGFYGQALAAALAAAYLFSVISTSGPLGPSGGICGVETSLIF